MTSAENAQIWQGLDMFWISSLLMGAQKSEDSRKPTETRLDVMIEEFKVLRSEISQYHDQQKQFVNYALIVLGAMLTAFSSDRFDWVTKNPTVLLLFPPLFAILGLMFADVTLRNCTPGPLYPRRSSTPDMPGSWRRYTSLGRLQKDNTSLQTLVREVTRPDSLVHLRLSGGDNVGCMVVGQAEDGL